MIVNEEFTVTAAVISYNGMNVIERCLESIYAQSYPPARIIVINNASTDGTAEWIAENFSDVDILNYPRNDGPNPARNLALRSSSTDLVLLVDDDSVLHEECLSELVEAAKEYPDAAVWSPRIVYHDEKNLIQFEGGKLHFIGEAILLSPETKLEEGVDKVTPIEFAGGVSYLVSKKAAAFVDFFDEDYFFGRTDGEFTFRLTLAGYPLYTVPKAICYHRVKARGLSKVYYQVRNRWYLMLLTYSWKTLFLLFPVLFLYEMSLILFLLLKKEISSYFRGLVAVLHQVPLLLKKRKKVQSQKVVRDRDVLHAGRINMRSDLLENRFFKFGKEMVEKVFNSYWQFVSRFV